MSYVRKLVLALIGILVSIGPLRGQEPVMVAHYVDVGQGLSVLLEFPCGAVLIDTGGQDLEHVEYLAGYLRHFFARRADLNNTLNTMFISHPHIDHTRGIRAVTEVCRVRNFVDDGVTEGSGGAQVRWIRNNATDLGIRMREVDNAEITALPHKNGLTDKIIDDVQCPLCDPKIVILSGGRRNNPGWTQSVFRNGNNHSLVIRVDFGKSSFLFTGDLEIPGITSLLSYYESTTSLRANVYQVGHHGSSNATTRGLAEAISPSIAVIGVGQWNFGENDSNPFTTYRYGHPRRDVIDLLSELILQNRNSPRMTKVFEGSRDPINYTVRKQIYATGWDGDVRVSAKLDGTFRVTTGDEAPDGRPNYRLLAKLSPAKRWGDEKTVAFDSVISELPLTYAPPFCNRQWVVKPVQQSCSPVRGFLFPRLCRCRNR